MQQQKKERKVYWGVVNPKGEPNSKKTYYFQECQLKQLANDIIGIPVKISHNDVLKNGKKSPPAGVVLQAHVHPKTGEVWAGFVISDNPTGGLAGSLLGEDDLLPPELHMNELSLGFDIKVDSKSQDPKGHRVKELSICYNAARPGCQIKTTTPYSTLLQNDEPKPVAPPTISPALKYNSQIFGAIINKYISETRESNSKKEKEKMEPLTAPPTAPPMKRPVDAQTMDDILNGFQQQHQQAAAADDAIIATKASASAPLTSAATNPMEDHAAAALERAIAQKAAQKRSSDEAFQSQPQPPQIKDKRFRLDFSKYINGTNQDFQEPVIPDDLPEQHKQFMRDSIRTNKELWAKNNQLEKEKRRAFLERIQQATDNFIPTYIEKLAADDKDMDKVALEAMMVAPLEYSTPEVAEKVLQFIEAQAKQGVDNDALRKDINQREKEYQDTLRRLAEENAELKKSQARPPLAPASRPVPAAPATEYPATHLIAGTASGRSGGAGINFKDMGRIEKVIYQASLRANQRAPNLPGNQMPMELIAANAKKMQSLWNMVDPLQGRGDNDY